MATVQIMFRDTEDGLVDVETTISGWENPSNAIALANQVNKYMAEIADQKRAPTEISKNLYVGKEFLTHPVDKLELVKA